MKSIDSTVVLLVGLVFLGGCATVPSPEFDLSHPANAEAAASPWNETTGALTDYRLNTGKSSMPESETPGSTAEKKTEEKSNTHGGAHGKH